MGPKIVREMLFLLGSLFIILGVFGVLLAPDLLTGVGLFLGSFVSGIFFISLSTIIQLLMNIDSHLGKNNDG